MSITIQEGRYYKRRNGEVVGPVQRHGDGCEAFIVGTLLNSTGTCCEDGRIWTTHDCEYDLVEEYSADGSPIGEVVNASGKVVATYGGAPVIGRKYDDGKLWAGTVLAGFWCIETTRTLVREVSKSGSLRDQPIVDAILAAMTTDLTPAERLLAARAELCDHPDARVRATRVGTYGARKYARDNWLHVEDGINRYYEAAGRHVLQILEGKWIDTPDDPNDPGSGLANLDHICWCIFAGATLADRAGEK